MYTYKTIQCVHVIRLNLPIGVHYIYLLIRILTIRKPFFVRYDLTIPERRKRDTKKTDENKIEIINMSSFIDFLLKLRLQTHWRMLMSAKTRATLVRDYRLYRSVRVVFETPKNLCTYEINNKICSHCLKAPTIFALERR